MAAHRAVATAITVATEKGTFVVLGAPDPRWRIDNEGKYQGIDALDAKGEPVKLPLHPGFVGGDARIDEDPVAAALREIREEMGDALADRVKAQGLTPIYTAYSAHNRGTTEYFHVHLSMPFDELRRSIRAGDDMVAVTLHRPADIVRRPGQGYVITSPPVAEQWRDYVSFVPYPDASEKKQRVLDCHNRRGSSEPLVGIDTACLKRNPGVYVPPGYTGARDATLTAQELTAQRGGPVPNGAILMQLVIPRLKEQQGWVARTASAVAVGAGGAGLLR